MTEHDEDCCCVYCRDARWAEDRAEDGVETGALVRTTIGMTASVHLAELVAAAARRLISNASNLDLETVRFEILRIDEGCMDVAVIGHLRKAAADE